MCDMTSIAAPPAAELAERLLGELVQPQDAAGMLDNTVPGQDSYYATVTRTVNGNADVAPDLHIDGYLPFGDTTRT